MFDIGFPELILISVVALVVIGPEKLPETVRTIALWIGRFKRSLSNLRMELENEIGADEIRQQLHNEGVMKELADTKSELEEIIQNADNTISDATASLKTIPHEFSNVSLDDEINDALEDPTGLDHLEFESPENTKNNDVSKRTESSDDAALDPSLEQNSQEASDQGISFDSKQDEDPRSKSTGSES
ncbi:MAG: sec-independent protein translocase protein TatB [Candidatus Azotimanducaceae bacterium]|jgi:sec-independent protein translocase protein TatB